MSGAFWASKACKSSKMHINTVVAALLFHVDANCFAHGYESTTKPLITVTITKAVPLPTTASTVAACAQVSRSWEAQIQTNPVPTVAAFLAHECLSSVPLGQKQAIELVDAIKPYLEYQSDDAYKADPPSDYPYPAYNIFDSLAEIRANLVAGVYGSELDFQLDLYLKVFARGHDGHLVFYPDALTKVFRYRRAISLVSISDDGYSALPIIKVYEDVVADPENASAVLKINGEDAERYLLNIVNFASENQDLDAGYNFMFRELAVAAASPGSNGYFNGGGRVAFLYDGPTTNLTFANGTVVSYPNIAAVAANMTGVTDGASFYDAFCVPKTGGTPTAAPPTPAAASNSSIPNYPQPVIATKDGILSGYWLEGEALEDVAVIVLLAFESKNPAEYQAVCQEFFRLALAAGKTKLVVDFQANGGGYILQGYDFFRQLFPHVTQDGFSRFKGSESFISTARVFSQEAAHINLDTSDDVDAISDYLTWYNWRYDLNLTDHNFDSFEAKFAPHVWKGTNYTSLLRWNLNDPLTTVNETFGLGIEISGYGTLANISQPFRPEDIILVYDGVCASTCTLASEMLRTQGGVKSIAFGGRPFHGPIQGVGGVKGSQNLFFDDVLSLTQRALSIAEDEAIKKELSKFTDLPLQRTILSSLNVRDQILRDNVNDGLPAQYVIENADCRLYWTAEMITDISAIWRAAANSAFNGHDCAYGGISRYHGPRSSAPHRKRDAAELRAMTASSKQRIARIREEKRGRVRSLADWEAVHRQRVMA